MQKKVENLKKTIIFRIFFKIFKLFDMAPHLGLEKIPWLGLAKKQKLLFIVQHMVKSVVTKHTFTALFSF
jgi:hypothetical protein